ncbi:hypothetical protein AMTRI_Chr02g216260 [Amborella trichopoda]
MEDQENGSGFLQLTNQRAKKQYNQNHLSIEEGNLISLKAVSRLTLGQKKKERTLYRSGSDESIASCGQIQRSSCKQLQQLGLMMGWKMEVGFETILDNLTLGLKPCERSSSSP